MRFQTVLEQRSHFKLDLHRYNTKQALKGKPALSEEEWERVCRSGGGGSRWSGSLLTKQASPNPGEQHFVKSEPLTYTMRPERMMQEWWDARHTLLGFPINPEQPWLQQHRSPEIGSCLILMGIAGDFRKIWISVENLRCTMRVLQAEHISVGNHGQLDTLSYCPDGLKIDRLCLGWLLLDCSPVDCQEWDTCCF